MSQLILARERRDPVLRGGGITQEEADQWPYPVWFDGTPVRRMRAGHLVNAYRQAVRWANGDGAYRPRSWLRKQVGLVTASMWADVLMDEIQRRWPGWKEAA